MSPHDLWASGDARPTKSHVPVRAYVGAGPRARSGTPCPTWATTGGCPYEQPDLAASPPVSTKRQTQGVARAQKHGPQVPGAQGFGPGSKSGNSLGRVAASRPKALAMVNGQTIAKLRLTLPPIACCQGCYPRMSATEPGQDLQVFSPCDVNPCNIPTLGSVLIYGLMTTTIETHVAATR